MFFAGALTLNVSLLVATVTKDLICLSVNKDVSQSLWQSITLSMCPHAEKLMSPGHSVSHSAIIPRKRISKHHQKG